MRKNTFPVTQYYLLFISCHSSQQKCPKWAFSKFVTREGILPVFPHFLPPLFLVHGHDSPATERIGGCSPRTVELFAFSAHFLSPNDTCGHQRRFTWQLSTRTKVWHACTQSLPHRTATHPRQANQHTDWGSQANWGNGRNASLSFLYPGAVGMCPMADRSMSKRKCNRQAPQIRSSKEGFFILKIS